MLRTVVLQVISDLQRGSAPVAVITIDLFDRAGDVGQHLARPSAS